MKSLRSQFDDIDSVNLETEDEKPTPSKINFRPTADTDQIFEDLETPSNSQNLTQSTPSNSQSTPSNSQGESSSQRPSSTPPFTPLAKKVSFSSAPVTPVQTPVQTPSSAIKNKKTARNSEKNSGKKPEKTFTPSPKTIKVSPQTLRLVIKGSL